MHSCQLIPFVTVLVAAAFAAVSVAWDSAHRATAAMAPIFLCAGAMAVCDLASQLSVDPAMAIMWLKLIHLPALLLGPFVLSLVCQMLPQSQAASKTLIRIGFAQAIVVGIACLFLPGVIGDVTPTQSGGWMPRYGLVSIVVVPFGAFLPVLAARRALRVEVRKQYAGADETRARAVMAVVLASIAVALSTDYALPLLGVPVPRLGASCIVLAAATMWLRVLYLADDLALSPQGMARSMLAELQDGVALVTLEGGVVSVNGRLAQMAGCRASALSGAPLSDLVSEPLDAIRHATGEVEAVLRARGEAEFPVSLSSSLVQDREGQGIGVVIVFRDRRDIDGLRRRVLNSGRMAAVGELAAGIAHEVNNPVAFIRADLNHLSRSLDEWLERLPKAADERRAQEIVVEGHRHVAEALTGIGRIAEVVGDVRGFAYVGGTRDSVGHPEAILEGALRLARLERRGEVEVRSRGVVAGHRMVRSQELKQTLLALLRFLSEDCAKGSAIDVELMADEERLRIDLVSRQLVVPAHFHVETLEAVRRESLSDAADDLDLVIAIQLVEELNGTLEFVCLADRSLRIGIEVPYVSDEERLA